MTVRGTYLLAVDAFAALGDRLPSATWDAPALGVWNLRDLVGHTAAAALTHVVTVLDRQVLRALTGRGVLPEEFSVV